MADHDDQPIPATDAQWRAKLTPEAYAVLRKRVTEEPFSGIYARVRDSGEYRCAGCDALLFASDTKFDSTTGWPSFTAAATGAVTIRRDWTMVIPRKEVLCVRCGGHLGHVFNDGPEPTGKRYCINSAALRFLRSRPTQPPPAPE